MKQRNEMRQIRKAYSKGDLARICTLREDRFGKAFGMETVDTPGGDYYHFRDNGSRVLAVAHLDTVIPASKRKVKFFTTELGEQGIVSGSLDDRLGAYVILCLLPALGITHDWLLTVGEEAGASTAEWFKPDKDYDWVIEFDRAGTDVVMYQFDDCDSRSAVESAGAPVGMGSFSDISCLEHLGVKAFNWGVGYGGNYHSARGYAYLSDTFAMVAKYLRFHEQNAGTAMPHDRYGYGGVTVWCDICWEGTIAAGYCSACGACEDCGGLNPERLTVSCSGYLCDCYTPASGKRPARLDDSGQHAQTWEEWAARRRERAASGGADEAA